MPSGAERHYRGHAGQHYHERKRALPERAFPWVAALRARKFAPYVCPADTVFEYGVGAGWNLAALTCARKIGCDVAEFLGPKLEELGIEFATDPARLPDAVADLAICHHTLEHLLEPSAVLHEIRRLLQPGGKLLVYVPFEREPRYERFRRDEPNHHLYSWNVQTLANLVEELGFTVLEASLGEFGYSRIAAVWAVRCGLGQSAFRALRRVLHLLRPAYEVRVIARREQ
jgi:SAM-dependent methyltransferase